MLSVEWTKSFDGKLIIAVKGNSLEVLLQHIYCDNTNCVRGLGIKMVTVIHIMADQFFFAQLKELCENV